jgi:hypothetical protein
MQHSHRQLLFRQLHGHACLPTQVSFDQDIVLSQMNEYEILQLLMGDCREKLQVYQLSNEEDIKLSQVGRGNCYTTAPDWAWVCQEACGQLSPLQHEVA